MLMVLDFDENARCVHPSVKSPLELQTYLIPESRHDAYNFMWNTMAYLGVLGNAAMWLYF